MQKAELSDLGADVIPLTGRRKERQQQAAKEAVLLLAHRMADLGIVFQREVVAAAEVLDEQQLAALLGESFALMKAGIRSATRSLQQEAVSAVLKEKDPG